ncbi:MAG TPA: class I SAM-dependent methyltransferase [Bacteroidia bacterium]|jgi:2-polyprenyl-3-methyl-5-hydroxy-6-metoxy-1,4-benzoquinol methylase
MKEIKYRFNPVLNCNMCGSSSAHHHIMGKRLNQSQGKKPKSKIGITTTIMKCDSCDLIFSNPQPVPFDISDHYGVPPESYWKEDYFRQNDHYFQTEIDQLKKFRSFDKGAKALDIGAGLGKCMIALDKAGFETFGLEPSEPFYKKALETMKINPYKLKLGMVEAVDYPENEFDFITFGAVLEHLYSPGESIVQALKWLKPQGIIQIEVPSSNWLTNKLINFYYRLNGSDYVGNISPMHSPFHLYEFGLKSFQLHGKKNNYEIIFYEYYVCNTYMPKIVDFLIKPYMKYTNTGMQLCVWLRKKD